MKKTHSLHTALKALLAPSAVKSIPLLANTIGIAPNTLRKLLRDDWDQVGRDTLEKVCDYLNKGVNELLELTHCPFWDPIIQSKTCTVFTGASGTDWDENSNTAALIRRSFPSVRFYTHQDFQEPRDVLEYARNHNCLILGGPKRNPACETILGELFGAKDLHNRHRIPFRFILKNDHEVANSILVEPWRHPRRGTGVGIWSSIRRKVLVQADWWDDRDEYLRATTSDGQDAAVVCVMNRPFGATKNVKTILLTGFRTVGTEAAARAVMRDFRDLEPAPQSRYVIGVISVKYKKTKQYEDHLEFVSYRWRFLTGGRKRLGSPRPKVQA